MRVEAAIARLFREQMAAGRLRPCDPHACARTLLGGLWQYAFEEALLRLRGRTPAQAAEEFVPALASLFWEGLAPSPSIPFAPVRTGDPS